MSTIPKPNTGSNPVLTANQLKTKQMNLKHIKHVILENLRDIKRAIEFLVMLTFVLTSATAIAAIACIISYKVALLFCGLLGIAI